MTDEAPPSTTTTTTDSTDTTTTDMKIDPSRASALLTNLETIQHRIATSSSSAASSSSSRPVRLVAVSKLKPANDILALHLPPAAHVHFGENYAQELAAKAEILPRSVRWHFIGGLQSTHCKSLARIPNLWCVSSVDTLKKATLLSKHRVDLIATSSSPAPALINVHVQVNTSGEDSKSGCPPGAATLALCRAIVSDCPGLSLLGLMTIGAIARSRAAAEGEDDNADFVALCEQRDMVARELGWDTERLEMSMGMSDDFENAIALGSGEVRVGSTIFGTRPPRQDANLTES